MNVGLSLSLWSAGREKPWTLLETQAAKGYLHARYHLQPRVKSHVVTLVTNKHKVHLKLNPHPVAVTVWHTARYYSANQISDNNVFIIGFDVVTPVVMKSAMVWGIMTYKALLANCFHSGFLFSVLFDPEDGGDMFLRNVG
jgi:hypothetical protein